MRVFGGVRGGAGGGRGGGGGLQGDDQGTYYDAMLVIANFSFQDENYRDAGALYYYAAELAKADNAKVDPYSYLRLSICYRKLGMHARAKEVLQKAVRRDRAVIEAVISTGANQYSDEDYEKAIDTYTSVLGMNRQKDPQIYWQLGLVYKKMGDVQMERESFERAVAAKVDYTDAVQSLAEVLHYRLKNRELAGIFQDIVDGKGTTYVTEKTLADLCYKYGNYTWAKSKYNAAARISEREKKGAVTDAEKKVLDARVIYAKIHAAMASYKNSMEDKAQEAMDALATEYPDHALLAYGRGQMALLKDDADTAVAAFKESMEKGPRSDAAPLALGEYYIGQGFSDEAIALWEGFLESNRRNKSVRRRFNALKAETEAASGSAQ